MAIHQSDPNQRPDEEFEAGTFAHLVAGAEGRLLDARRTPVRVVELCDRTGQFTVQILAFEDVGARWMLPYEDVGRFQFEKGRPANDTDRTREIEGIARRFDRMMTVPCEAAAREETQRRLWDEVEGTRSWLRQHSAFLAGGGELPDPERREADPRLLDDFAQYMAERDLWDIEDAFSATFVSAPFGELIKGHRIVIAELGLVPYKGKIVRDETIFDGRWGRDRRKEHVTARLAFLRGLAVELDLQAVTLYRGVSSVGPLRPNRNETFVSATFSRAVAESLFSAHGEESTGALYRQVVPVHRLFMTYLETAAMNRQFKEAEAILLFEEGNALF